MRMKNFNTIVCPKKSSLLLNSRPFTRFGVQSYYKYIIKYNYCYYKVSFFKFFRRILM